MPGDGRTTLERPGSSAEAPGLARHMKALKTGDTRRNKGMRGSTRRYEEIRGDTRRKVCVRGDARIYEE